MYYAQINHERVAYAVTETAGQIDAPDMIALQAFDESVKGQRHNAETGGWESLPPPPDTRPRHLAPASFKRRFTQAERIGIREATKVSAEVYDFMDLLDTSKFINLDDPLTQLGLQQLEAGGLLDEGRADEILSAPVLEEERP